MKGAQQNFLGLLLGIFGIFLFWSAFTNFSKTQIVDGFVLGTIIVGIVVFGLAFYLAKE